MQLFAIIAFALTIYMGTTLAYWGSQRIDNSPSIVDAQIEVDQYKLFLYAGSQYAQNAAAVSSATTVPWSTIVAAGFVPPAASAAAMPSSWRIVLLPGGQWLACASLSEQATATVAALVPPDPATINGKSTFIPEYQPVIMNGASSPNYVVLGKSSETSLTSYCP